MPAPISVVIPTLNAAPELAASIHAMFEGLDDGLIRDLIISDGGSGDDIGALAGALGATLITGPAGRGGQLARGAAAARGEWLLFLHADTRLAKGWSHACLKHLADRPDKAGYFRLAFRSDARAAKLVATWANLRSAIFGLPYGDQGLLISRAVYDRAGGYPDLPLMEDVALARRLRGNLVALAVTAETSADRYIRQGWLNRGGRNLWTLARYFAGVPPAKLARDYRQKQPR